MQPQIARRVQTLLTLAILVAATYLIGLTWSFLSQFVGTFLLFFLAWLLAYLLKPLVRKMTRAGLPSGVAVLLVYITGPLIAMVVGYLLVSTLAEQATQINDHLDEYTSKLGGLVDDLAGVLTSFGVSTSDLQALEVNIAGSAKSGGQAVLQGALNTVGSIGDALLRIGLVLIFSISFLVDGDQLASKALAAMPGRWREGATLVVKSVEESFGGFVRGQLLAALAYAILNAAVMIAFGLPNAAIASLAAGLFIIVPLVGNYLAYLPPVLTCLVARPDQTWVLLVAVVIVQGIYMNLISPRIMAKAVNMHPLATLASILIFGQIGGFWGAFFGIPIASTIGMLARPTMQFIQSYLNPRGETGAINDMGVTGDTQPDAHPELPPTIVPRANSATEVESEGENSLLHNAKPHLS